MQDVKFNYGEIEERIMSKRITDKDLQAKIDVLNDIMETPREPRFMAGGKLTWNVGNYHLSGAYGGVCVHRVANDAGGVDTPIVYGYVTKRELYNALSHYIEGVIAGKIRVLTK